MTKTASPLNGPQNKGKLKRGTLWINQRTRRYYLKIKWPADTKYSYEPLRPAQTKWATKQKGLALAIARDMIKKRLANTNIANTPQELIAEFGRKNMLKAAPDQVTRNMATVKTFLDFCGLEDMADITTVEIEDYLVDMKEKGKSQKTLRNHVSSLSAFCQFLKKKGCLEYNPASDVELGKVPKRPPVSIPPESIATLKQKAAVAPIEYRAELILAIEIALACGPRISEIAALRYTSVRKQDTGWTLIIGEDMPTKSKTWRNVPLPVAIVNAIMARKKSLAAGNTDFIFHQIDLNTWGQRLRIICKGLEGFNRGGTGSLWHALRASCATQKAKDRNMFQLMQEMGWTTLGVARQYINIAQAAGA